MASTWWCVSSLTPPQRLEVLSLLDRTESLLGREAIDEGRRRTVVHGWRAQHWLYYDGAELRKYAMSTGDDHAVVEMCGGDFEEDLLTHLLAVHEVVDWWTRGPQTCAYINGKVTRMLELLRVKLPVDVAAVPAGAILRNFEAHRDEGAWLEQNNAAFANHPEQGAWHQLDLDERTQEPWFDPSGFLLLEIDGRVAASCWTKVHELHPDRFGEIYVVSVHPDFQHHHLGRVMVTQGLNVLWRKGVSDAVLFVDESNESAKKLYASLGFRLEREDRLVRFTRP
ncbi:MAG TPA: GNAT family N-acetyltransferase [Acidimicrobiales bacterium]|nr:GNAT family N-acetyltransferase [Acidimicrobiales bacterium]